MKSLDPLVGVIQMWTKGSDYAPKNECANFFYYVSRKVILKNSSLIIFLSSQVFIFSFQILFIKENIITIFLCHGSLPFSSDHLFCLSHRKMHWTMSVDNVGPKICLLGTSNSMVTLTIFFFLCKLK